MTSSSRPAASKPRSTTLGLERCGSRGRSRASARPSIDAIWSMIPVGAPTTSFSAVRPTRASATRSRSRPQMSSSAPCRSRPRSRPTTTARRRRARRSRWRGRRPADRRCRCLRAAPTRHRAGTRPTRRVVATGSGRRSATSSGSSANVDATRMTPSSRGAGERDVRAAVDRERQHEAVVVVGVLADEVDAARRRPGAERLGRRSARRKAPGDGAVPAVGHRALGDRLRRRARRRAAAVSGGMSPIQAPIAASEPARNLSLSAARRGRRQLQVQPDRRRAATSTGAWCHAAMYGVGVS